MILPMKELLERFKDCDTFSLTSKIYEGFTMDEYLEAIKNSRKIVKENLKKFYDREKDRFNITVSFEKIFSEVERKCETYYADNFGKFDENLVYNSESGYAYNNNDEFLKKIEHVSIRDELIDKIKYDEKTQQFYFQFCGWITADIRARFNNIKFCSKEQRNHTDMLPIELKNNIIKCEFSFGNEVSSCDRPMVNYYFKLNGETKNYLLQFKNDFELDFEDFALYKNGQNKYYSLTHEGFNSIEVNYRTMSQQELDEYLEREVDSKDSIKVINEIIKMDLGTEFSFESFGINDIEVVDNIYWICHGLKLYLKVIDEEKFIFVKVDEI